MALIVEDGTGLTNADSYQSLAGADAYHAALGNASWTDRSHATGSIFLRVIPSDGETVVIDGQTYRFKTALAAAGDVLIGATVATARANLVAAISFTEASIGVAFHAGTAYNSKVTAAVSGAAVVLTAVALGEAGNLLTLSETMAATANGVSGATFSGGLPDRELALKKATRYLDQKYGGSWRGLRTNEDQALDWPRCGVVDDDDMLIEDDELPQDLLDAESELGLIALDEDLMPDTSVSEGGTLSSESVSVGPISVSQSFVGGKPTEASYKKVRNLLRSLTVSMGTVERG